MTDSEIIDLILKQLYDKAGRPCVYLKTTILKDHNISLEKNHLARILMQMVTGKLASNHPEKASIVGDFCLKIGQNGLEILNKHGSYLSFLQTQMSDKEIILETIAKMKQFDGFVSIELIFNDLGRTNEIEQQHLLDIIIDKKLVRTSNYSDWDVQITELGKRLNPDSYDKLFSNELNTINFIHNEIISGDKIQDSTLHGDFKPKKTTKNTYPTEQPKKSRLKTILYDPYTVTIIGGLILALATYMIVMVFSTNSTDQAEFKKPLIELQNYKIRFDNEKPFPPTDTLTIKIKYNGSKVALNRNFQLLKYKFTDNQYFYKDPQFPSDPELEILESYLQDPVLDSLNTSEIILIQLKRKMIFNGVDVAYFKTEDKKIIGNLTITFSYNYNNKTIQDTLNTNIYVVKGIEAKRAALNHTD